MFKIFLLKSLLVIIFFQGAVSFLVAAEVCYFPSDLGLRGDTATVKFYHTASVFVSADDAFRNLMDAGKDTTGVSCRESDGKSFRIDKGYSSVVIYSLYQLTDHTPNSIYDTKAGKIYVYRLGDKAIKYHGEGEYAESIDFTTSSKMHKPPQCARVKYPKLIKDISGSDTVVITFGAGISDGFVPTLIEFMEGIGLEKMPSHDRATEDSFQSFIHSLFADQSSISRVGGIWGTIFNCKHEVTPAHKALFEIINILRWSKKEVYVYTDNVDRIHHKVGIKISDLHPVSSEFPVKDLKDRNVVVLACGQSFDFQGVLTAINSLDEGCANIKFYSLNTKPDSILVYDDCKKDKDGNIIDYDADKYHYLDMGWIEGPLGKTLPEIEWLLRVERAINQILWPIQSKETLWLQRVFQCFYSRNPITIVLSKEDVSELQQLGQIWAELHKYAASYGRYGRRPLAASRLLK